MSSGGQGQLSMNEGHGRSWVEEEKPSPAGRTAPAHCLPQSWPPCSLLTSQTSTPNVYSCSFQVSHESSLHPKLRVSGSPTLLMTVFSLLVFT